MSTQHHYRAKNNFLYHSYWVLMIKQLSLCFECMARVCPNSTVRQGLLKNNHYPASLVSIIVMYSSLCLLVLFENLPWLAMSSIQKSNSLSCIRVNLTAAQKQNLEKEKNEQLLWCCTSHVPTWDLVTLHVCVAFPPALPKACSKDCSSPV